MAQFKQFDTVRLLQAHEGPGNYSQGVVHAVPAGTEGTVLEVFGRNEAFEVEFIISRPEFHGDEVAHPGTYHVVTLTPDHIAPA